MAPGGILGGCTQSSCHDDGTINTGPGTLQIEVDGGATTYLPGATHLCRVTISHPGVIKFGFQGVVLTDGDTNSVGDISLTNDIFTQTFTPRFGKPFYGREYVTHTKDGTLADVPGQKSWTFLWTAPNVGIGDITIYVASMASNNNEEQTGDDAYSTSLTLTEGTPTGTGLEYYIKRIRIFPNPFHQELTIWSPFQKAAIFDLYDLTGKLIGSVGINEVYNRIYFESISNGLYLYQIRYNDQVTRSGKLLHK